MLAIIQYPDFSKLTFADIFLAAGQTAPFRSLMGNARI